MATETVTFGRFGSVAVYRPADNDIRSIALFLSGDEGWDQHADELARNLSELNAVVVGIDTLGYLRALEAESDACADPAAELRSLAKFIERQQQISGYIQPMLIGYGAGAALGYAALAEAQPNSFKGSVLFAFCPQLALRKPLCAGAGVASRPDAVHSGIVLEAVKRANAPLTVLHGQFGQACDSRTAAGFVDGITGTTQQVLTDAAGGFAGVKSWLPQFEEAYMRIAGTDSSLRTAPGEVPEELADLPIIEITDNVSPATDVFAIFFSGDGGWATLDDEVSHRLAAAGVPVVGISSLKYFWSEHRPDAIAADVARIAAVYGSRWGRSRFALVGYSLGADILPFAGSHLEPSLRRRLASLGLLSPERKTEFQFHVSDWVTSSDAGADIGPELGKLQGVPIACLYGTDEADDSLCTVQEAMRGALVRSFDGGHHLAGDYDGIAASLLSTMLPKPR